MGDSIQQLEQLVSTPELSMYQIKGQYQGKVERYVFSTEQTRQICNVPEIIGVQYTTLMEEAMTLALKNLPGSHELLY